MMKHIFGLILFLLLISSCGKKHEQTTVAYKDLVEAVYSSVVVDPVDEYNVNASVSGYLEKVLVSEGDLVKKGDLLFVISNEPISMNRQNAQLNYELMQENLSGQANVLNDLRLTIKTLQLKMQNDSVNMKRYQALFQQKACTKAELDNATLAYASSRNDYQAQKNSLKRKEIELSNQLKQSKNSLNATTSQTDDYYIRSNINGKVFAVNKEQGELVSLQEPIAVLGDSKDYKLKMSIDEVDISRVELNQKVLVTLEAYGDRVFEAYITKIYPKMDEQTQTFEVEAFFKNPPQKLYMGLTGEGNIIVNEHKKALVIPRDYLQPGNKVETENGLVSVKTGLSDWDFIEILSGLEKGTVIYKPE